MATSVMPSHYRLSTIIMRLTHTGTCLSAGADVTQQYKSLSLSLQLDRRPVCRYGFSSDATTMSVVAAAFVGLQHEGVRT